MNCLCGDGYSCRLCTPHVTPQPKFHEGQDVGWTRARRPGKFRIGKVLDFGVRLYGSPKMAGYSYAGIWLPETITDEVECLVLGESVLSTDIWLEVVDPCLRINNGKIERKVS